MSFELRLEVPAAQSRRSTSATRSPRSAAARATPAPVMPPPMTRRSSAVAGRAARVASRVSGENGEAIAADASGYRAARSSARAACASATLSARPWSRAIWSARAAKASASWRSPRASHTLASARRVVNAFGSRRSTWRSIASPRTLSPPSTRGRRTRSVPFAAIASTWFGLSSSVRSTSPIRRRSWKTWERFSPSRRISSPRLQKRAKCASALLSSSATARSASACPRSKCSLRASRSLARRPASHSARAPAVRLGTESSAARTAVARLKQASAMSTREEREERMEAGTMPSGPPEVKRRAAAGAPVRTRFASRHGNAGECPFLAIPGPSGEGIARIQAAQALQRRAMAIFPRNPRRPPGRPATPHGPADPAARPPSVGEVLREQLREIAAAADAPEDALEPALRAILEASRAQAGALCLFDQRHGILRLVAEVGFSEEGCRRLRNVRRTDPTAWDMPLNGLMNRRAYLIESAARNRYVPQLVENAAAVRTITCLPLHAGPTPVGSLVLVALAPRSFTERDVRTLERPLGELATMIEAVRRRGGRGEPVEAPRAPVAAPPPLPRPAAAVTELQAEREQLRGEVAARAAERAVLAAELAARSGETDRLRAALELAAADRARLAADFGPARRDGGG